MRLKSCWLILVSACSLVAQAQACTTILVGADASSDGSLMVARNDDTKNALRTFDLVQHPAESYPLGSYYFSNSNQFRYPRPANALAYSGLPRNSTRGKPNLSFEEIGFNSSGVTISATETIYNSKAALKVDPYLNESGINEDSIPSVVLAQAISATDGVRLLGKIIETQGAAEGFGVALADASGIWYLETASGHHWVAFKLPADKFFVSANQGRTQNVDLSDPQHFLSSPQLGVFAQQHGLLALEPTSTAERFNFFNAFVENGPHDKTYNYPRIESLELLYTGSSYTGQDGQFPLFETPTSKLSLADVKAGLREHYVGSSADPYMTQNPQAPQRPISVMRAIFSHVTQIRPNLPPAIGNVEYIAIGMPDLSIYLPFYQGLTSVPPEYQNLSDGKFDDKLALWKYRKLQALVLQNYPKYAPKVHRQFAKFELALSQAQADMEQDYLHKLKKDPVQAAVLLQKFTTKWVAKADALVDNLSRQIIKDAKLQQFTADDYAKLIDKTEQTYHYPGA